MRIQFISIDLITAMPIVLLAILVLFAGLYVIRRSYLELELAYAHKLSLYSDSQIIVQSISTSDADYSSAVGISSGMAKSFGVNASIFPMSSGVHCQSYVVCRLVYIRGSPYVLEVRP